MALKEFRGSDGKAAQGKARKDLEGKKTPGGGIDNGEGAFGGIAWGGFDGIDGAAEGVCGPAPGD
jgi:hypothetical protein